MIEPADQTPSRGYASPLRDEQARQTRRRIVDAASRLLLEHGYSATTMAGIAEAAGVSAQTVYKAFGTKAALVKQVYDVTLINSDEPIPVELQPELQAALSEPDPRRFLATYADLSRRLLERLGPLIGVLQAGAHTGETDLVALLEMIDSEQLTRTMLAAEHIADLGAMHAGLSVERACDAMWTLASLDVWRRLVHQRGWTSEEYTRWVARAMAYAVLAPGK